MQEVNEKIFSVPHLMQLNEFIHGKEPRGEYHMLHIAYVAEYANILSSYLGCYLGREDPGVMDLIAYSHDILKDKSLSPLKKDVIWEGHEIPQNLNRYVRQNLDVLEKFDLDDYFNTDIQLHPLSAGIFLYKEFGIDDPEILYPVFFHSCPIMDVYEHLDTDIQKSVDIILLADKLSSNYLRINMLKTRVKVDLDAIVFGEDGLAFNYDTGLFVARLIAQGAHPDHQSLRTTQYYQSRAKRTNPFIRDYDNFRSLGGKEIWPERKSMVLKTPLPNSNP